MFAKAKTSLVPFSVGTRPPIVTCAPSSGPNAR